MSVIILRRSQGLVPSLFRGLSFTHGTFQPSVAYKSVAYEEKGVTGVPDVIKS